MSEKEASLIAALSRLEAQAKAEGDYPVTGCHAIFTLAREQLLPAAKLLLGQGYFLEDLSGVDVEEGILLVYHFDRYDRSERVVLRALAPHQDKKAPSIALVFSGADWHERECFDFFGVQFEGHPNLKPLLLPDDLGINPLLKEEGRKSLYSLLPFRQLVDAKH